MWYCIRRTLTWGLALWALAGSIASGQAIHGRDGIALPPPPEVKAVPVTDDYFGTKIVDNYRWLEDANSPETKAFIDDENAYTARYMEQARIRPQISDDLDALEHVSTWTVPIQRGNDLFFEKMLAGEDQPSIYVRHGWAGKDKRLIDPAQFSRDPNTSVNLADVSRDGTLVAYGCAQGGADETTVRVFNVKTGKTLVDELPSGIYLSVAFTPDGKGLYYSRMDRKGTLVYKHELGTRASHDTLVFGREFRGEALGPSDLMMAAVSDDYRYLVIEIDRGVPREARRYRLPRPDQAGLVLRSPDLGRGLAVFSGLRQGRLVCEHELQIAQLAHHEGRPRHHARYVDDHRARRAGRNRQLQHRGWQDLRQPASRCEDRDGRLHAGRQTRGQRRIRRHRVGDHPLRPRRRTDTASTASSRSSCRPRSTGSTR